MIVAAHLLLWAVSTLPAPGPDVAAGVRGHDQEVIVLAEFHREDLCPDLTPESDPEAESDGIGLNLAWPAPGSPTGGTAAACPQPAPHARKRYSTRSPVLRC